MDFLTNKFVMMVLPAIFKSISPLLVSELQPLVNQLKETAKATSNPWDDILVVLIEEIVTGIMREKA